MNITTNHLDELNAQVSIQLTSEDYIEKINKALKDYQKKMNLPGFRPGKVPLGMVKKMVGKSLLAEELSHMSYNKLVDYLKESNIETLGYPIINMEKTSTFDEELERNDYQFTYDIGIKPSINIKLDDSIKVDYYSINIDDAIVKQTIENIQTRYGSYIETETVDEKSSVYCELIEIDANGVVMENGIKNSTYIAVDVIKDDEIKNQFLSLKKDDNFALDIKKLTGDNATEMAAMLNIPREQAEEINSLFDTTVLKIEKMQPAALDAELFKKVFFDENIETEEAFRDKIVSQLQERNDKEAEFKLFLDVKNYILENNKINLPDAFLKKWIQTNNDKKQISDEDIDKEYDSVQSFIRWDLIMDTLMKEHGVNVTHEEIKDNIRENLKKYFLRGDDSNEQMTEYLEGMVNKFVENKEEFHRYESKLINDKLTALFKEKIALNKVHINYDEFSKILEKTA